MKVRELERKWSKSNLSDRLIYWSSLPREEQDFLFSRRSGNDTRIAILRRSPPERAKELFGLLSSTIRYCLYSALSREEKAAVTFPYRPSLTVPGYYLLSFDDLIDQFEAINSFDKAQLWASLDEGIRFELWHKMDPVLRQDFHY